MDRAGRCGLLFAFVALGTGLGAIAGLVVAVLPKVAGLGLDPATVKAMCVALGFALGWWLATRIGSRWLDDDAPGPRSRHGPYQHGGHDDFESTMMTDAMPSGRQKWEQ